MKRIKNLIAVGAFSLLVLGIPAVASAQYSDPYWDRNQTRDRGGYGDRYGHPNDNRRYDNYGNYGNMSGVVRSLKARTREFTRQLDRDLDNSRANGTRREDRINHQADRFRDAVNRISDRNTNWGRRDNAVERALQEGSQLERSMRGVRLSYQSQSLWYSIRNDLQALGNGYGYDTRNNRGNRTGGGWNNGRVPSWWPF